MVSYTIGNGRVKVKMAENVDKIRRYVYTRWEDTGFPMRVNHAVTSYMDIHGRGFVYSLGGFKGKGKVIPRGGGYEQWPDLGRVPMDVVELDIGQREWRKLYPRDTPEEDNPSATVDSPLFGSLDGGVPGRYAHSCVFFQGKIYLYGGRNDISFFEKVECFNPVTSEWSVIQALNEYGEPMAENELPAGRYAHACSLNGHIMYIQGGTQIAFNNRFFDIVYTEDLYSFNLITHVWKKEQVSPHNFPLKRDFHTGQYLNGEFLVFGGKWLDVHPDDPGFYSYNFSNSKWSKLSTSGYSPPGRRSLQSVRYGENSIIFFGGFSTEHKIFYSDLFMLNTVNSHITKIEPYGLGPSPRRRVGFCLVGSDLIVCGGVGRNGDKSELVTHNDMYILSLVPSLKYLCMGFVMAEGLPTDSLPLPVTTTIYEMSSITYKDSQKLVDDVQAKSA